MSEEGAQQSQDQSPTQDQAARAVVDRVVDRSQPAGWDLIDFEKLPDDVRGAVQQRIDRLYGQVKSHERERREERQYYRALDKKLDALMEENRAGNASIKLEALKERALKHFDDGENEKGIDALRGMVRLEREAGLTPSASAESRQQADVEQPRPFSPYEQRVLGEFFERHKAVLPVGSKEQHGMIQWLAEQLSDGAPVGEMVAMASDALAGTPAGRNGSQARGAQGAAATVVQQVLGQSAAVQATRERSTPKLSEEQRNVARRFYPKLEPEKAYEKYAANLSD